jgi:arylsulfatase A-like enzyme
MRRRFCVLAALAWVAVGGGASAAPDDRPNVVFILADDLGVNDLSCYGRADQSTPRLDALARQGLRFTSAYAAQTVCSPTRAAIMTGKSPARLHLTTFLPGRGDATSQKLLQVVMRQQLPLEETTLAELFKASGYATAQLGKWHLGGPAFGPKAQGFDEAYDGKAVTKPSAEEGGKGEYDLTAHAESFIEANKERPFFLYLCHNASHIPLAAQPERLAAAKGAFNPVYAAVVATLDDAVGRLLDRLDALGLAENTIVVFTSDNGGLHAPEGQDGPATHNTPFRAGKGFVYEGGLRVPLIVRWPKRIAAGKVVETPVVSMDWLPTFVDVCKLEARPAPAPLDGASLAPLLLGGALPDRPLFWHYPHYANQGSRPSGAVRVGTWKLVEHYEDGRVELYDLARDPGETRDLASTEPSRARDLREQLAAWRRSVGAQTNDLNPSFDPALHKRLYEDVDVSTLRPAATAAAMRPALESWRVLMGEATRIKPARQPNSGPTRPSATRVSPGTSPAADQPRSR